MFNGWHDRKGRPSFTDLPSAVPALQDAWEFRELLAVCDRLDLRDIVEIGSCHGGTLYHWLIRAKPGDTVIAIDWSARLNGRDQDRSLWRTWVPDGVCFLEFDLDSHLEETRDQVQSVLENVDCLFIDGDHGYESVQRDFCLYGSLVRPGGIIALHDIYTKDSPSHVIGVRALWSEIRQAGYLTRELVTGPAGPTPGIGIIYIEGTNP